MNFRPIILLLVAWAVIAPAGAGWAGEQDEARRAYQAGEVVSLGQILNRVTSAYECRVLAVELNKARSSGSRKRWVYSVKAMTRQGHILMFKLDGMTMNFLSIAGRGADAARRKP